MTVRWLVAASWAAFAVLAGTSSTAFAEAEEAPPPEEAVAEPSGDENMTPPADLPAATASPDAKPAPSQNDPSSKFAQSLGVRDPFWPVAYKPKAAQPAKSAGAAAAAAAPVVQAPKWDDAVKTLDVSGIMKTPAGFIANVEGQIVGQGETVTAEYENRRYSWKIESINASGVSFQRLQVSP